MIGNLFDLDDDPLDGAVELVPLSFTSRPRGYAPPDRRASSGFVGLANQGATCYLNSLVQALYMTPEFRSGMYQLSPEELGIDQSEVSVEDELTRGPGNAPSSSAAAADDDADPMEIESEGDGGSSAATAGGAGGAVRRTKSEDNAASGSGQSAPSDSELALHATVVEALVSNTLELEEIDERHAYVKLLLELGFTVKASLYAARKFKSNLDDAVDWLLCGGSQVAEAAADDDAATAAARALNPNPSDTPSAADDGDDTEAVYGSDGDDRSEIDSTVEAAFALSSSSSSSSSAATVTNKQPFAYSGGVDEFDAVYSPVPSSRHSSHSNLTHHDDADLNDPENTRTYEEIEMLEMQRSESDPPRSNEPQDDDGDSSEREQQQQQPQHQQFSEEQDASSAAASSSAASGTKKKKVRKILVELQSLFARLQCSDTRAVSTKALTDSFGWGGRQAAEQHDVHELNRVLFDAIERSLKRTSQQELISGLYLGERVFKVKCLACGKISERDEAFQDLTLTVKGKRSILDSLHDFSIAEKLEGSNQYECSSCEKMVDARRWESIRKIPPVLIISLARFEYDWEREQRNKNVNRLHYPLVLDMAPFVETVVPDGGRDTTREQEEAAVAAKSSSSSEQPTTTTTAENDDHQLDEELGITGGQALPGRKNKSKFNDDDDDDDGLSLYEPEQNLESPELYDLFAVIIHVGKSGEFGHYHAYIRDVLGEGHHNLASKSDKSDNSASSFTWYDFDDSSVLPIAERKLMSQYGGRTECAYMLVYRKRHGLQDSGKSAPIPEVPQYLRDKIAAQNAELAERRERWDRDSNLITLKICTPYHYELTQDGVVKSKAGKLLIDFSDENGGLNAPVAPEAKTFANIEIDMRKPLRELRERIVAEFAGAPGIPSVENMKLDLLRTTTTGRIERYDIRIEAPDPDNEEGTSIADAGASNKMELLVWDGESFQGKTWKHQSEFVKVSVCHLCLIDEAPHFSFEEFGTLGVSQFELEVPCEAPITMVRRLIQEKTLTQHELLMFVAQSDDVSSLLPLEGDDTTLLSSFQITNRTSILVERKAATASADASTLLAAKYLLLKQTCYRVLVRDLVSGNGCCETISVVIEKTSTLSQLKTKALKQLGADHFDENGCRLRKSYAFSGEAASLFADEGVTVDEADIGDGTLLLLEEGAPLNDHTVTLTYTFMHKPDIESRRQATFDRRWTIKECIDHICELAGETDEMRMWRTDHRGKPLFLFQEPKKTLREERVSNNSIVLLEKGKLPAAGEISMALTVYRTMADVLVDTHQLVDLDWTPYSPANLANVGLREGYLTEELPSVPVLKDDTLLHLKRVILQQNPSLRENGALTPYHLRVWSRTRVFKYHAGSLKKHFVQSNTPITLQILREPETFIDDRYSDSHPENVLDTSDLPEGFDVSTIARHSTDDQVLTVFVRDCERKRFRAPVTLFFNNRTKDSLSLQSVVAKHFGIPEESLVLAKYRLFTNTYQLFTDALSYYLEPSSTGGHEILEDAWRDPVDFDKTATSAATAADAATGATGASVEPTSEEVLAAAKKARTKNLCIAQYVTDGDIFLVKDARTDPHNLERFPGKLERPSASSYSFARPSSGGHSFTSIGYTRMVREEAQLKIDVDDFDLEES